MKTYLMLMILLCSSFISIAQDNLPPACEIKTDTADYISLDDAYWQMLEDSTGKLTIDQVSQSPIADKFHFNEAAVKGIDRSIRVYWYRYRIKNTMTQKAEITFPKDAPYADFYIQDSSDEWDHKVTGRDVPWSRRDGLKRIRQITYTIQPGKELLVYNRDKVNKPPQSFGHMIGFVDKIIQDEYVDNNPYVLQSFLFGLFLIAALFNLYFFLVIHQRVYLYFSLTIAFHSIGLFVKETDIFFHEQPSMQLFVLGICIFSFFFFLIHFIRYFLETFKHFPRWDKCLVGLSVYLIIFWVLMLAGIIPPYVNEALGFPNIFLFITFILFLNSPDKSVRIRVITALPAISLFMILGILVYVPQVYKYTGAPMPTFLKWIFSQYSLFQDIVAAWLLILFSESLLRRYQQMQKQIAFEATEKERIAKEKEMERSQLIEQQKVELEKTVEERTAELKHSLSELKSTQSQLIQQEKMASLGELTAGIAHEIQNPLNFVNNFSEVNKEMIEELLSERSKVRSERDEELENEILNDIKDNEEKINHHGKRADAIVKGMLLHSRQSSGKKEPTDINALADEYLRLSYHGMRAKEKDFNAAIQTDFDESIGKINVVPQDIGKVLLNLFNNAFYATNQKQKDPAGSSNLSGQQLYVPTVTIVIKNLNDKIEIKVNDNGNGIPQNIIDKIFQPFFTTKPTGQGTGLGLSLAYDIIKAHGGEIKVETKEGKGSEFVIQLPV